MPTAKEQPTPLPYNAKEHLEALIKNFVLQAIPLEERYAFLAERTGWSVEQVQEVLS
jgi:hypothetical protein